MILAGNYPTEAASELSISKVLLKVSASDEEFRCKILSATDLQTSLRLMLER